MKLKQKTAIVTGSARGIGKAIAKKFLKEGATVLICDLKEDMLLETYEELKVEGEIYYKEVDVTSRDSVEDLVKYAKKHMGRIDILANNAGIARFAPFIDITDKDWNDTIGVNLNGVFLCSQIVAREMIKQRSGAIVNMSSSNGIMGEDGLAHYNASNAGVKLLSKTLAIELAPYNIRANNVCPGFILTELALEGGMSQEVLDEYTNNIPLSRYGKVEEVANAFSFLASDEASFITGTELVVDGGQLCEQ